MVKVCSDTVIEPIPKSSGKVAKRVKVRKANFFSETYNFMTQFYETCYTFGARKFIDTEKNYSICRAGDMVFPMLIVGDFGENIPYFPDEHSAEMAIEKLGKDRLLKYWFNANAEEPAMTNFEYMKSLSPEKLSEFLNEPQWCNSDCAFDGDMRGNRCGECILKWLNSKRKEDEKCSLPF